MARSGHRGRQRGQTEHFTKMIRSTMETPAWRALSPKAQALYPWFKLEWRGPQANNNGKISFSVRQAAQALGVADDTANKAMHELQAKGFLVVTQLACMGVAGVGKATCYEITEYTMPYGDRSEGRKLFKEWSDGADFPVQKVAPNNPDGRNGN